MEVFEVVEPKTTIERVQTNSNVLTQLKKDKAIKTMIIMIVGMVEVEDVVDLIASNKLMRNISSHVAKPNKPLTRTIKKSWRKNRIIWLFMMKLGLLVT